jgi:cytochrome c oxidase subunit II
MRRTQRIAGLLIAAAALAGICPTLKAAPEPKRIEVTAKRFSFEPAEITLKKGEPVDLVLNSVDVPHGIRLRELNVDVKVGKGGRAEVHFAPTRTGTFVGHCSVFCGAGHGAMTLKVHVVD